jgi:hypothetical protein
LIFPRGARSFSVTGSAFADRALALAVIATAEPARLLARGSGCGLREPEESSSFGQ